MRWGAGAKAPSLLGTIAMRHKRLWWALAVVFFGSFLVLGTQGVNLSRELPPIPERVVTAEGAEILSGESIQRGQNVWQSIGGQEVGSIWGHGGLRRAGLDRRLAAPREPLRAGHLGARRGPRRLRRVLRAERQAALRARLTALMRTNTLRREDGHASPSTAVRAEAFAPTRRTTRTCSRQGRHGYAIPAGALTDPARLRAMAAFFFWTAGRPRTNRPGRHVTLHAELAARAAGRQHADRRGRPVERASSVVLLLAGIGGAGLVPCSRRQGRRSRRLPPARDPLSALTADAVAARHRASTSGSWRR